MSDRRPPAGLVGIPRPFRPLATPTLLATEALEPRSFLSGCRETSSPFEEDASGAVLVPPTGNRVLNQIPAGDGRESSREQAVPDDGAPLHRTVGDWGREIHFPSLTFRVVGGRAASLTHKKKKKKVVRSREVEVGPDHYFRVVPTGQRPQQGG